MAQSVKINGVTYSDVDKVQIPLATDTSKLVEYLNTEDATAVAASVKKDETFYAGGKKVTGTMAVNGTITKTLDTTNTSATIPEGYTSGGTVQIVPETKTATPTKSAQEIIASSGKVISKVTVAKIPDTYQDVTGVTAAAADVKSGKKIVDANGNVVTGTHTDPSFTLTDGVLAIR